MKTVIAFATSPAAVVLIAGMASYVLGFYLMETPEEIFLADGAGPWRAFARRLRPFYPLLLVLGFALTALGVLLNECSVAWSALRFRSRAMRATDSPGHHMGKPGESTGSPNRENNSPTSGPPPTSSP
jgi:hypothetical protein